MDYAQLALALCMGIALSAACGFRVFVPLLAVSLAARHAGLEVGDTLAWVRTDAAFICLAAATVVEVLAYYIPLLDHALDVINTPLAMVAGVLITCGLLPDMPEFARWGIGIVAGAGASGMVQLGTAALRGLSTGATATLGNPIISTVENGLSVIGSVLAIVLPVVAALGMMVMAWLVFKLIRRLRRRPQAASVS